MPDMMLLQIDLPIWIVVTFLFIIGAMIGSFLNVCIYRIPTQERFLLQLHQLWNRPSHCRRCGTNIQWYDNIPIFGWLKLRGRCRTCRMRISPRYPLIEFLNGCLWVIVFMMEVPLGWNRPLSASCVFADIGPQVYPGLGPWSPEAFVVLRFFFHIVLIEALLVATMIDFDLKIIPDGATLPAMIFAVIVSATIARVHLVPIWFQSANMELSYGLLMPEWMVKYAAFSNSAVPGWIVSHPHLHGLLASIVGLLVGGGIVWAVRLLGFLILRQEAMGFGDVVLMAMIGAFIGWQASIIAFFIAPACAIVVVIATALWKSALRMLGYQQSMESMIPYGPYLSLGTLLTILFWNSLFEHTRHVFEMGLLLIPFSGFLLIAFLAALTAVQLGKRLLGIKPPPEELQGSWRAADQTWFFKGEHVNRHTGRWKSSDWEGSAAGQGRVHVERWQGMNSSSGSRLRPPRRL